MKPSSTKKPGQKRASEPPAETARRFPWSGREVRDKLGSIAGLSFEDRTRAEAVADLVVGREFQAPRPEALRRLYPEKSEKDADKSLRAFTSTFNRRAGDIGLELRAGKGAGGGRILQFLGPDNAAERASSFTRQAGDLPAKPKELEDNPGQLADPAPGEHGARAPIRLMLLSSNAESAEAAALADGLKVHLEIAKDFHFTVWDSRALLAGENRLDEIEREIRTSHLVAPLLSPALLKDIPSSVWENLSKRELIPVTLSRVSDKARIPLIVQNVQWFQVGEKGWKTAHARAHDREEFCHRLAEQIIERAEKLQRIDGSAGRTLHRAARGFAPMEVDFPEDNPAAPTDLKAFDELTRARPDPQSALGLLEAWVCDRKGSPYGAVLGEFGLGKTTTLKRLAHCLLDRREKGDLSVPLPIYLDLRIHVESMEGPNGGRVPELEPFLDELLRRSWKVEEAPLTGAQLLRLAREEGVLLILDGLDEKLVHLDENQGKSFIRMLWGILPPRPRGGDAKEARRGRLLLSCRSHYFRSLQEQNRTLTGSERDEIGAESYFAIIILPFQEGHVRSYLAKRVGESRVDQVMALIGSIHNLSDLAPRPFFLKLIQGQIERLEAASSRGQKVYAVTLYENLVQDCLERDAGKHQLQREDKPPLMADLATAMWASGAREWKWDRVFTWLRARIYGDPVLAAAYPPAAKPFERLAEDFRTATLILRPDKSAEHFRFAHTSLQEYFLACGLHRALEENQPERWALPPPSRETLDFVGQLLAWKGAAPVRNLTSVLEKYGRQASRAAFQYWLVARESGWPAPSPSRFDLPGEDLTGIRIAGSRGNRLNLRGANFEGATLIEARFHEVDLSDANLRGIKARQVEFDQVDLSRATMDDAVLIGAVFRDACLNGIHADRVEWWDADWIRVRGEASRLPRADLSRQVQSSPPRSAGPGLKRRGHSSSVNACAFSPDGSRLLSGSDDNSLILWDAASGQALLTLTGHRSSVDACAFSPDGSRLLSGSWDNSLILWDAASGQALLTLTGHTSSVTACAFSPDGSRLLSGSWDNSLILWDAASGQALLTLTGHTSSVDACAFSPDGSRLLSGSTDNSLILWDAASGQALLTLTGHRSSVTACAFSRDGSRLLSGSWDDSLILWDAASGQALLTLTGHTSSVTACAFSPDGSRLLSGSDDNSLILWDAASGQALLTLTGHRSSVTACAFSPDGSRLLSGSDDNSLILWDAASGQALLTLTGHRSSVTACAFSPDGSRLLSGSDDNSLILWDAASGQALLTLTGHTSWVTACAFSPDGSRLLSGSTDNSLILWDAASGQALLTLTGHTSSVTACAFSPDGSRLLSGSLDNSLILWDAASGQALLTLTGHRSVVTACAFSPDGSRLLSGSRDNSLILWDAASGQALLTLTGHRSSVTACAFSPDGSRLLSGSDDNSLILWDAASGQALLTLTGHTSWVNACAFSPDGSRLLSGSRDNSLILWDAASGQALLTLSGHTSSVTACAFSPDGSRLLSGSADGTLRLWDAVMGEHLLTLAHLPEHAAAAFTLTGFLSATPGAWRHLCWRAFDPERQSWRVYPAEGNGPLPIAPMSASTPKRSQDRADGD